LHTIASAVETEEYRTATYELWQAMAAGWDADRALMWEATRQVSERLLAALALQPGETVLELACGTGETGFAAARAVGPQGTAILSDFAPNMVDAARRAAGELGLNAVEVRQMDAERMDLDDDSVDAVFCRWGYMLMADRAAALAETRRVLREGGRLALSVWGARERNPWAAVPGRVLMEKTGTPPPEPDAPGMFSLAEPDHLRAMLGEAGFADPHLEEVDVPWRFDDFDEYWRYVTRLTPIGLRLPELSEAEAGELRAEVERGVAQHRTGDGLVLPGVAVVAAAS
jgi:ubiquinone/menaquinone biosynthesis C-methylase UbiE